MLKFIILGKNGQVGWELQNYLSLYGSVLDLGRDDEGGDLLQPNKVAEKIKEFQPNAVFNAAAYTTVDKAETEQEKAFIINAYAIKSIAAACKQVNSILVHYSTDYIFDGSGVEARTEDALPNPINVYGESKLEGEKIVFESGCRAFIFRTSWVYGTHGKNFVKTILRKAKSESSLHVISDQIGTPTSADFIANVSSNLIIRTLIHKEDLLGVYNLVPNGVTSWYNFAKWIVSQAASLNISMILKQKDILPIYTSEYPTPARRPLNSRLNNHKLCSKFYPCCIKDWEYYALRVLTELSGE